MCIAGESELEIKFWPMAEYGKRDVQIRKFVNLGLRMLVGRGVYWLRSSVALSISDGSAHARIVLRAGESMRFSLTYSEEARGTASTRPITG